MFLCVFTTAQENYRFLLKSNYLLPFYMYGLMMDWHLEWDAVKSGLMGEMVCKIEEFFTLH